MRTPTCVSPMLLVIITLAAFPAFAADLPAGKITNSVGMELLPVKAGAYTNIRLKTKITLTRDFYLGQGEVTQKEFQKVMGNNPSHFKGKQNPVDSVTWPEAVEFCQKLSELPEEKAAGRVYSLPSSAEWEYACRAGTETLFPWGNEDETVIGKHAWCRDWYGERATGTHPVGQKKANAWGFQDMLGNVWELCSDKAKTLSALDIGVYYGVPKPEGLVDPVAVADLNMAIIRGGAWNCDHRATNSIVNTGQPVLARDNAVGFRVKCVVKLEERK